MARGPGDAALLNTYKFLSQVGEYTAALNKKAAAGGAFTPEDRATLETLLGYAALVLVITFLMELAGTLRRK